MTVAVNNPVERRRSAAYDDMDVLLKGVGLAIDFYGQKANREQNALANKIAEQRHQEQMSQNKSLADREYDLKVANEEGDRARKDRELALKEKEVNAKIAENRSPANIKLPKEKEKVVEGLATKNANMETVKNFMAAKQVELRKAIQEGNEDNAVKVGQEMLKIINSPMGSDAVGAEESKRLGSFLEYKIANFTQPGSFIGRDLDKFDDQITANISALDSAIGLNNNSIEKAYGRAASFKLPSSTPVGNGPQGGTAIAAPSLGGGEGQQQSGYIPGSTIIINGKRYLVDSTGTRAEPIK